MVRISADNFTKTQLGIDEEISDTRAKEVVEQLRDNKNYQLSLSDNQLVIKRFIRD